MDAMSLYAQVASNGDMQWIRKSDGAVVFTISGQSGAGSYGSGVNARPFKTAILALSSVHAGVKGIVNPEGVDCIITGITLLITTVASAAGAVDIGTTASSITTSSDNIADGLDVHSGTAPLVVGRDAQAGTNGKSTQYWTAGKWVTVGDDGGGDVSGFVGSLYIRYFLV